MKTTHTSKEAFQNSHAHILVYLNTQMGLIHDKAWCMTKRFPKLESKTEIRIGCFKYRGRDRVFRDWNKISSNFCHWPELTGPEHPHKPVSSNDAQAQHPHCKIHGELSFSPDGLWGWSSKSVKISSAGTWCCRTAVPLYPEAHTHTHTHP